MDQSYSCSGFYTQLVRLQDGYWSVTLFWATSEPACSLLWPLIHSTVLLFLGDLWGCISSECLELRAVLSMLLVRAQGKSATGLLTVLHWSILALLVDFSSSLIPLLCSRDPLSSFSSSDCYIPVYGHQICKVLFLWWLTSLPSSQESWANLEYIIFLLSLLSS